MKPRPFLERAQRIIDALDARLEGQTFKPGADAPHAVAIVGVFHEYAGHVERAIGRYRETPASFPSAGLFREMNLTHELRSLRRIVETHRIVVNLRAIFQRNRVHQ